MNKMIEDFIVDYLRDKSQATQRAYRFSLIRFERYLAESGADLENLIRDDVQGYVQYLQTVKKRTASTVRREFAAIAAFCQWSGQEAAVERIRLPKTQRLTEIAPKSLERNVVNQIKRELNLAPIREQAIVNTLLRTGMRVSELVALDRSDVQLDGREEKRFIRVRGKGNKERLVPVTIELKHILERYLETRRDNHPALFITEKGKIERLSVRQVQRICQKYGTHPHQLRHTFGHKHAKEGTPLTTLATIMGHNDATMTMRYSKPTLEEMIAAVDRADF